MSYLVDTHCHLHDQEWFAPEQAEDFLARAKENNVQQVVVIGTDPGDSAEAEKFAAAHENVFWTFGIHPEYTGVRAEVGTNDDLLTECAEFLKSCEREKLVAIGEVGLDYHYEGYDRERQIRLFEQMLQLAKDNNLPVSLHIREAFEDAFAVMDNFPEVTGVVHSFTGSKKCLRQILERGFYVGVNGLATYTTPPLPPLEKMLLETDAPFLTPTPFRGTINSPAMIRVIAEYLADKMGVAVETLAEQTTENARKLFHIRDTVVRSGQEL